MPSRFLWLIGSNCVTIFELVLVGCMYPEFATESLTACLIFSILSVKKEANSLQALVDNSSEATDVEGLLVCPLWQTRHMRCSCFWWWCLRRRIALHFSVPNYKSEVCVCRSHNEPGDLFLATCVQLLHILFFCQFKHWENWDKNEEL